MTQSPAARHVLQALRCSTNSNEPSCLVVAPLTVQSATSHGITFHTPLMMREETLPHLQDLPGTRENTMGVGVDGRPADCVKLAVSSVWPQRFGANSKPDLLISGINAGRELRHQRDLQRHSRRSNRRCISGHSLHRTQPA